MTTRAFLILVAVVAFTASCGISIPASDKTGETATKGSEKSGGQTDEPTKPIGNCSADMNEWGHPGQCQCPEGSEYRQQTGDCQASIAESGTPAAGLACTTHSDCEKRDVSCDVRAVHKDEPQVISQNPCGSPTVEPSWGEETLVADALCIESKCQLKARSWKTLPGVKTVKISGKVDRDVKVEFAAEVQYCSHKPAVRFYVDTGADFNECNLYFELAHSPFDTCDAAKTGEVAFAGSKYGLCDLSKAKSPEHPDLVILRE